MLKDQGSPRNRSIQYNAVQSNKVASGSPPALRDDTILDEVCDLAAATCRSEGAFIGAVSDDCLEVFARSTSVKVLCFRHAANITSETPSGPPILPKEIRHSFAFPEWFRDGKYHVVDLPVTFAMPCALFVGGNGQAIKLTATEKSSVAKLTRMAAILLEFERATQFAIREFFAVIEESKY